MRISVLILAQYAGAAVFRFREVRANRPLQFLSRIQLIADQLLLSVVLKKAFCKY
jgi:hypothetical protein